MNETYKIKYRLDSDSYTIYLNATSQQDAVKEIKARESAVVIINVEKAGRTISAR